MQVMLVGNPNCGKTTLFNALTGENQRVGNWPGVTVEKKTGVFNCNNRKINIIDLPGVYSLAAGSDSSMDARIAVQAVLQNEADVFINVVDASSLERHLYLTSQLLELGRPVIVVLTMQDIAASSGIKTDTKKLAHHLGCPVIAVQAHKKYGIDELYRTLSLRITPAKPLALELPKPVLTQRERIITELKNARIAYNLQLYIAHRIIEGDAECLALLPPEVAKLFANLKHDEDILLVNERYSIIHDMVAQVQKLQNERMHAATAWIDKIFLHRFWGLPIFMAIMYAMFFIAINIGGIFQEWVNIITDAVFVDWSATALAGIGAPLWSIALLAHGLGKGINTTLTFIPVIFSMYICLATLELSGYMARAAFVVDRLMRMLGLPGKAFVPMIIGFGCNVPAIMAARTMDSEHDRLLTVIMSPFMSCSARLAIYAVFVAAFFPDGGQNIVFSLYMIGILMAVFTGFVLKKTMLRGKASPMVLDLPVYHKPDLLRIWREARMRLKFFIVRAGKVIIPVCMLLGLLDSLTFGVNNLSVLAYIGQKLTPLFAPMGVYPDNWPATVGLLTGMLAKEVVVGTLNTLYTHLHYGVMSQYFAGKIGAYAYLLFVLLYVPCVSTVAAMRQEAGRRLMWFSVIWSFVLAYGVAVLFYQIATILSHPRSTFNWILAFGCGFYLMFKLILHSSRGGTNYVASNS